MVPNYGVVMKWTCMGAGIGEPMTNILRCAVTCSQSPNCFGFSWFPSTKSCQAHAIGCHVMPDLTGPLLYKKGVLPSPTTTMSATLSWKRSIRDFIPLTGTRCVAGTSSRIGELLNNSQTCATECRLDLSCAGFNVNVHDGTCSLRTFGCVQEQNPNISYYQKQIISGR